MRIDPHLALTMYQARAAEVRREAAADRRGRRPGSRPARPSAARRRIGRSMVRLGTRLAGDPSFTPVRSR